MTPAVEALRRAGVKFELHEYKRDPAAKSFGEEAAEALGVDPWHVFKTVVVSVDGRLVVGVVPVVEQLDLNEVASACKGKRAAMADTADAERATGYVVGGISPLGRLCTRTRAARRPLRRSHAEPCWAAPARR